MSSTLFTRKYPTFYDFQSYHNLQNFLNKFDYQHFNQIRLSIISLKQLNNYFYYIISDDLRQLMFCSTKKQSNDCFFWCRWPESNRHGLFNRRILSPVRLPVPPHLHFELTRMIILLFNMNCQHFFDFF